MLKESLMEQRYDAVVAVIRDGMTVSEVALKLGISRQSLHRWMARYEAGSRPSRIDRIARDGCRTRCGSTSRSAARCHLS